MTNLLYCVFVVVVVYISTKWCTYSDVWLLHGWWHVKLLPSRRVLCTPCTMSRHCMQIHIRRVHACLVVTCHLHCWQNDRDLLPATAITREWNGYRNKTPTKHDVRHTSLHANPHSRVHACLILTCHLHFWQNDRPTSCSKQWPDFDPVSS